MTDDILERAARALREESARSQDTASFTRARVMASLHRGKRRKRWHVTLLVPIAAVLAGSTALAAWQGNSAWQRVVFAVGLQAAPPAQPRTARSGVARTRAESAGILTEWRGRAKAPIAPSSAAAVEAPPPSAAPKGAAVVKAPNLPERDLALYRAAHRAHFSGSEASEALDAWERYLREVPRGRFALEASYNRAICLARLGRAGEARRALEPFASGAYGSYRQNDARALIEALGGD